MAECCALDSIKRGQIIEINSVDRPLLSQSWLYKLMMEIYDETHIKTHLSKVAQTHTSRCSWKVSLWWRASVGRDLTRGNELCPDPGNDLMTSNEKPTFSFTPPRALYSYMFRPSKQLFLCLHLNVLRCCTVYFLLSLHLSLPFVSVGITAWFMKEPANVGITSSWNGQGVPHMLDTEETGEVCENSFMHTLQFRQRPNRKPEA